MLINKLVDSLSEQFSVKYLMPFGIELSALNTKYTLHDINSDKLKNLIKTYKIVVIRNLNFISQPTLVRYAESIGPLLAWDFGVVMEMRAHAEPKNYLFTNGSVPFHWDGAFHKEPRYLLFHCVDAPLADC